MHRESPKVGLQLGNVLSLALGRKRCHRDELVPLILASNAAKKIKTYNVKVQTLTGTTCDVKLDVESNNKVSDIKTLLQGTLGTRSDRQELMFICENKVDTREEDVNEAEESDADEEATEGMPLYDDEQIVRGCTLLLSLKPESPLKNWSQVDNKYRISGQELKLITRVDTPPMHYGNCMTAGTCMFPDTGKHTISLKLDCVRADLEGPMWTSAGASPASSIIRSHAWSIAAFGGLKGPSRHRHSAVVRPGEILPGQVLTMQLDTDHNSLLFWVDGKRHGPGFTHDVTGSLRWAIWCYCAGNSVEIVPTPELGR